MADQTPIAPDHSLRVNDLRRAYHQAVSVGAVLTGRTAEDERLDSALKLLAGITVHIPLLRLLIGALDDSTDSPAIMRGASRLIGGVLRLADRALEVHARDVGYSPDAWRDQAVARADALLLTLTPAEDEFERLDLHAGLLHDASSQLAAAIAAVPTDRMAVPTHLAAALAAWLTLYVCATDRTHA